MLRRLGELFVLLSVFVVASPAQAGWSEFWHRVHLDWHRMNSWPEPFQHADRQVTIAPLIAMTNAGWQQNNTLHDHFFDHEGHLTRAGQLRAHWIATQAPLHRRTIFVLRDQNLERTNTRVESVHRYLQRVLPEDAQSQVILTDVIPPGGSGEYFDEVIRQRKSSMPEPRLPEMQSTSGGG
jgi:hypothetical protein